MNHELCLYNFKNYHPHHLVCMGVLPPHCLCTIHMPDDCEDQKKAPSPMELESQMVVSYHMGAEN